MSIQVPNQKFIGVPGVTYAKTSLSMLKPVATVRYEQVNAMLLNEFLKEHQTVQELKKEILSLIAIVNEQGAQIQRVSAQIEVSKPSQQVVDIP